MKQSLIQLYFNTGSKMSSSKDGYKCDGLCNVVHCLETEDVYTVEDAQDMYEYIERNKPTYDKAPDYGWKPYRIYPRKKWLREEIRYQDGISLNRMLRKLFIGSIKIKYFGHFTGLCAVTLNIGVNFYDSLILGWYINTFRPNWKYNDQFGWKPKRLGRRLLWLSWHILKTLRL